MGKTRETFEERAERYECMQETLFDEDSFELMLKCLTKGSKKKLKELTIIDAGCGTGQITVELAKLVRRVFGIDLTPKMLGFAKKHAKKAGQQNVIFEIGDAQTLENFSDNSIDGIVCRHTFHHFQKPTLALENFARVLKDGGRAVIIDTVADSDRKLRSFFVELALIEDETHEGNSTKRQWGDWAHDAGFSTIEIVEEKPIPITFEDFEGWMGKEKAVDYARKLKEGYWIPKIREYLDIRVEEERDDIDKMRIKLFELPMHMIILRK
jgi:ubiquinone/menaquinone biosynthesis C-methylase UbiE